MELMPHACLAASVAAWPASQLHLRCFRVCPAILLSVGLVTCGVTCLCAFVLVTPAVLQGVPGYNGTAEAAVRAHACVAGACRVVLLSRLVYRKGVDLQVAAIPELCRRHPALRFLIGGDGPKRGDLEDMVRRCDLAGRVRLVGSVRQAAVRDLLVQGATPCTPSPIGARGHNALAFPSPTSVLMPHPPTFSNPAC